MTNSNENKQQDRIREIDELLFECQRHNIPAISVTYAQLKALRAVTNDITPKMQAFAPMEEMAKLRAANARLQAWHDAVMGQETIGFEIVFKTGKWLKYDPSGFAPETKTELIIRPQPLAKE